MMRFKRVPVGLLAFLLWAGSLLIGLWEIVVIQEMLYRLYARFVGTTKVHDTTYWGAVLTGHWLILILSLAWLGFAIGTGEYHSKRVGQPSSWRLFGWTLGVEFTILVLAYFV